MQLRFLPAIIIYLVSYLPLSLILLCQDFVFDDMKHHVCNPLADPQCELPFAHPWAAIGTVVACALALGLTIGALALVQLKRKICIKDAKHVPADLMNYSLPYIVSFMGLYYTDTGKLLGFPVFFIWIFLITYRSGQVILNPVLTVFGWQLYDVTYSYEGDEKMFDTSVLSRVALRENETHAQAAIQDVLIVKE